jgi:hypothetical protein
MPASAAGYLWTAIPFSDRDSCLQALDSAGVDEDIAPFVEFLAGRVLQLPAMLELGQKKNGMTPAFRRHHPIFSSLTEVKARGRLKNGRRVRIDNPRGLKPLVNQALFGTTKVVP